MWYHISFLRSFTSFLGGEERCKEEGMREEAGERAGKGRKNLPSYLCLASPDWEVFANRSFQETTGKRKCILILPRNMKEIKLNLKE